MLFRKKFITWKELTKCSGIPIAEQEQGTALWRQSRPSKTKQYTIPTGKPKHVHVSLSHIVLNSTCLCQFSDLLSPIKNAPSTKQCVQRGGQSII